MLGIIVGIILFAVIGFLVFAWWQSKDTIELEGIILRKLYEATQARFYFVIEINGQDILTEYCEYTSSKEEWMTFEQDEKVKCDVYFYLQETIIKSIKK